MALRVLPLPLRVLLLLASAGGVDGSCADDYGCSLAGKCVAGGKLLSRRGEDRG